MKRLLDRQPLARSRAASRRPRARWASRPSRCTRSPTPTASTSAPATSAVALGGRTSAESYLDVEREILAAARTTGADAMHPGYGFLAENAAFAAAVEEAGLTFVGPTPEAIDAMGDKIRARELAEKAGVPVLPSADAERRSEERATAAAAVGFPVLVKAAAGGGGRGMRRVRRRGVARRRDRVGAARSRLGVRRRARLHGEVRRRAASHRDPGLRRHPRPRARTSANASARCNGATRRSSRKLLAPSSTMRCARRSPSRRRSCARRSATAAPAPSSSSSRRRRALLPRGEHPPAGRASRSPKRCSAPTSCAGSSRVAAGGTLPKKAPVAARPRHRMPHLRGGSGQRLLAHRRHSCAASSTRAVGHARRHGVVRGLAGAGRLRLDARQGDRLGSRPRAGTRRMIEALERFLLLGVRTNVEFLARAAASERFVDATFTTSTLDRRIRPPSPRRPRRATTASRSRPPQLRS